MDFKEVLSIIQTLGIIGALIVAICALNLSKKDITSRLRPYVFIDKFNLDEIYKGQKSPDNLVAFTYQITLKNVGQSPAIIKDIKLKETLSRNPELFEGRTVNFKEDQIIYPDNNVHIAVPKIGTEVAKLMRKYKNEDIYNAEIIILYSQLGTNKIYTYARFYSLNPNLIAAPKFGLKSIIKIN